MENPVDGWLLFFYPTVISRSPLHYVNLLHISTHKPLLFSLFTLFLISIYSPLFTKNMNSMKRAIPSHFIWWKNSFSNISRKCILPNMIGAVFSSNKMWRNDKFHGIQVQWWRCKLKDTEIVNIKKVTFIRHIIEFVVYRQQMVVVSSGYSPEKVGRKSRKVVFKLHFKVEL